MLTINKSLKTFGKFCLVLVTVGLILSLTITSPSSVRAHGTIDQSYLFGTAALCTLPSCLTGQEFTPTVSNLVAVDLFLVSFSPTLPGSPVSVTVNIRAATIAGSILGTKTQIIAAPAVVSQVHFDFDSPIPLTPGVIHVIQVQSSSNLGWGADFCGVYPGGVGIQVFPNPCLDFKFVTYFSSVTAFASFSPQVELSLGPNLNDDELELKANFTLGSQTNGINPLTEDVTLGVGSFSITIPADSFEATPDGGFKFEGTIDNIILEAKITPLPSLGLSSFSFKLESENLNLSGISNPVTTELTIGDDQGSSTVTAEIEPEN